MSVKDTYKGWRTTLMGILIQALIGYVWYQGIQPIEVWSIALFLSGFGLWFMPDKTISKVNKYLNKNVDNNH